MIWQQTLNIFEQKCDGEESWPYRASLNPPIILKYTVVYMGVSPDASKVWFTEWASNRIGYLDNTLEVPLDLRVINPMPKSIKLGQVYPLEITVNRDRLANTSLSLNVIELSLIGMTEFGLQGLTYLANPQRINLTNVTSINGTFGITVGKDATAGKYTVTPRITTFEKDNLTVSLSRSQPVILDVPVEKSQLENLTAESNQPNANVTPIFLRDLTRYGSIAVAAALIAYLVYRKIFRRKFSS